MPRLSLSDPETRAKVFADLREAKAEKRAFHVIRSKDRWVVLSERAPSRKKSFADIAGAIEHARGLARNSGFDLVVHAQDGSVQKVESFREQNP